MHQNHITAPLKDIVFTVALSIVADGFTANPLAHALDPRMEL